MLVAAAAAAAAAVVVVVVVVVMVVVSFLCRFYSLAQNYLRRCDGVLLMFDITKRSTFEGIRRWQAGVTVSCR